MSFKVLIVNEFGNNEVVNLPIIPRIGDTLPLFYKPWPKVQIVCLLPEKFDPSLKGYDAIVTV